jgi:uncharacterized protein with GYD domain
LATYFILGKFTDEGVARLLDDRTPRPDFRDVVARIADEVGVEVRGAWITAGVHDGLLQLEAPSTQRAIAFALAVGATVGMRTETLAADDDYGQVMRLSADAHTRHRGLYGHTRHSDRASDQASDEV